MLVSSGTMQTAIRDFAELVQSRANSLEGQQACHVYVTQELVSDMKDRLEGSQLADALTSLCEDCFLEIGWDWTTNKASTGPVAGMLMSASKIKSALSKIAEKCANDEASSAGSATALRVEAMSIDDDPVHKVKTSPAGCAAEAAKPERFTTRWEIGQSFETQDHDSEAEPDFISTVEFDDTGEFIAAATRLGKIHVFRKNPEYDDRSCDVEDTNPMFNKYLQFQSHNAEFDYLKSLEIEERINSVRWCRREAADTQLLLATNDKTIKLWKLKGSQKRSGSAWVGQNVGQSAESPVQAKERMVFQNGHIYHINSLSLNSDGETFLTSDDLRINLWHTGVNTECFNIVDLKPVNMDDLSEVITSAEFHPSHCHTFIYGSSKGCIRMGDMRAAALCDEHTKNFHMSSAVEPKSFFSEIISSISDVKFSHDSQYILSRDFMTLKLWDVRVENQPVQSVAIHDHLRAKLCDLYENDGIFDKFECSFSNDSSRVITGSYDHRLHMYAINNGTATMEAMIEGRQVLQSCDLAQGILPNHTTEFENKCLHTAYAPQDHTVAVAATSEVLIIKQTKVPEVT